MVGNKGRSGSSKYWATIIYDCKDVSILDEAIKSMHMKAILSPLHDKDVKQHIDIIEGREYKSFRFKEPHYHLMVHFPNGVSEGSFRYLLEHKIPEDLHCKGAELVGNFEGMARYFIHLDNPEKAQYDREEILYYLGLDESCLESPKKDKIDKTEEIAFFVNLIATHQIEDLMSLNFYVSSHCPEKLQSMIAYSGQIERFTRGMYQLNQRRKEMFKK